MTSTQRRLNAIVSLVLPLTIVMTCSATAASAPSPGSGSSGSDASLGAAVRSIEIAFKRRDAHALRPVLSRRGKVFLSIPAVGIEDGYYGSDQVVALLDRVFRVRETLQFALESRPGRPARGGATLTGLWRFRMRGGSPISIRLRFVLASGESGWSIRELRELK